MSNETLQALPVLALLLELSVLAWRLRRRDARPMIALNGLAAIGLAIPLGLALAQGPESWAEGFYQAMLVFCAFELAVLATSVGWVLRRDWALGLLAGLEFAVHVLLTVAAAVFAFTFQVKLEL